MKYVGLQAQITNNNIKSILLLVLFPVLILMLVYLFFIIIQTWGDTKLISSAIPVANEMFINTAPYVFFVVGVWFVIAYFTNAYIIEKSTGARPLERRDNKRVYNLVENLCMSVGMPMPKVNIIDDDSLNAFASGINQKTFTVTLSSGIIDKLDDEELEGVIAHELTHIRNRDVRLLIVSIVFVGIFSFLMQMALRMIQFGSTGRSRDDGKGGGGVPVVIAVLILAAIGYFFSTIFRFAISRNREYMADAGAAQMTRRPWALANALKKISEDSRIEAVTRDDVAQLFIEHPMEKKSMGISSLFATHPRIEKRIQVLEQF